MLHIMKKCVFYDTKRFWCWIETLGFISVIVTRNFTELEGLTKEREGKHVIKLPGRFTLFSSALWAWTLWIRTHSISF